VFDSLLALAVLVLILGVVSWALVGRRREGSGASRRTSSYRRRARWATRLPVLLIVGALLFLALSFTQFRFLKEAGSAGTVVLAMDVSESMGRTDVQPNRLEAAKEAARVFLDRLPPELQVGLVTFAARADVVVAPTTSRSEVVAALNDLPRSEGTVLGDGLDAALGSIEAEHAGDGDATAAVILLSDGRDCGLAPSQCPSSSVGATVPAADAAARAKALGVQVYTVRLGQLSGSEEAEASIALLQDIADTTGGSAYTADTASGLIDVYETLETRISTELDISDYGALLVAIASVLAIAATIAILVALRSQY
jgi:Ca-activated chloride channel family protein